MQKKNTKILYFLNLSYIESGKYTVGKPLQQRVKVYLRKTKVH